MRAGKFVTGLTLMVAAVFLAISAEAREKVFKLPHKTLTLANGMKVFMVQYPSKGVVSYQIAVHVGSRNEVEAGKTGFAHFFEHLMFRGTKKRSGKEFGDLYTKIGCENNAWTWLDMTNYHGLVSTANLSTIFDAESDRFANLYFDEKMLRDEAGAVLGEYNKNEAQPENILEEKLLETAFKVHPYSHTTMGYKKDVLQFTERYADVWPFFKRHYRPENVALVLVGDIDFVKTEIMVRKYWAKWKGTDVKTLPAQTIPPEPEQNELRKAQVRLDKPAQTRITVAYKIPAFSTKNKESAALQLLAEMLFSVTSDFQKVFRYEKKWIDAVNAVSGDTILPMMTVDPGLWPITVRLTDAGEANRESLITAIVSAVESMKTKLPVAEKLVQAKRRFRNSATLTWFSSPEHLAGQIAVMTNFEQDLGVLERSLERIEDVGPKDLQDFSKKYLKHTSRTVVTLQGSGK